MINKTKRLLLAAALAVGSTALFSVPTVQAADMGAKGEPIKLAMHEWTGQHITTLISGKVLEKIGYSVE